MGEHRPDPSLAEMIAAVSEAIPQLTIEEVQARRPEWGDGSHLVDLRSLDPSRPEAALNDAEVLDIVSTEDDSTPTSPWPRRVGVAIAAAAVALIGVGFLANQDSDRAGSANEVGPSTSTPAAVSSTPPGDDSQDTEALARQFVDALNRYDSDAITSLLAPEVFIQEIQAGRIDDYAELVVWYEALDWQFTLAECDDVAARLSCSYRATNRWSTALGHEAERSGTFLLGASGGQLDYIHNAPNTSDWGSPVVSRFRSWVLVNDPDAAAVMWSGGHTVNFTPESIELFRQKTTEFEADHNG